MYCHYPSSCLFSFLFFFFFFFNPFNAHTLIQSIDFILSSFQNSALAGSANSGIRVVATRTLHKAISNLFAAKFSVSASLSGAREKREKNVRIDCIYADKC